MKYIIFDSSPKIMKKKNKEIIKKINKFNNNINTND